jgi:phosphoribosyl 1,2-cyclic phosphodiesterase
MRFASLGSGSAGNALVAEVGDTVVLLDCGFGLRETVMRLARLGFEPQQISGIIVTHEHDDHVGGAFKFSAKFGIPLYLTHGTLAAAGKTSPEAVVRVIDSHHVFSIGGLEIHPFPVPHDAREPVQYVLSDGLRKLGVLTDVGASTAHIESMLSGCDALVLECNHDIDMLMNGSYPKSLKQRIGGRLGHLANHDAATLLSRLDQSRLQHVIAAHLSEKNNRPQLAKTVLSAAMNCEAEWIGVADQAEGFGWRQLM